MKLKNFFLFVFILTIILKAFPTGTPHQHVSNGYIRFTENKNQWDSTILYRAQLDGGALYLEKNCFTYSFYDKEARREQDANGRMTNAEQSPLRSHAFKMTFLNALKNVESFAAQPSFDYCNYFIGNDKSKWASHVKNYSQVHYKNIYKNIHLEVLGSNNSIKYNFYVEANANAHDIQLFYEGLENIELNEGLLRLKTSLNELVEQRPYAYQWVNDEKVNVPCEFVLKGTTVSFRFPKGYDTNYELVIDPVLVFAATSGSAADNFGHCGTYDADGYLYAGGIAFSQGYPTTLGAFDLTYAGNPNNGNTDVVITKYDSSGTFLHYSTYLGGSSGTEVVTSLIVDAQNNIHFYGVTGSWDFPFTPNAYDTTFNWGVFYVPNKNNGNYFGNGTDIFVGEFNSTGSALLASTYIGGSDNDGVNSNNVNTELVPGVALYNPATGQYDIPIYSPALDSLQYNYGDYYRGDIRLDKAGNVIVATSTRSADFPAINAIDDTLGGLQDAVVFKFNNSLTQLIWSTYLGGSDNDCANAIELDDSSNVYVVGGTRSSNFPTTPGTLQLSFGGGKADGYITKLKQDGSSILSSTYWGTLSYDQCYEIQLDKSGNVYTFGQTEGPIPVTAGVYNNPNSGQFVTKIDNSLSSVIYSTVIGNSNGLPNISPTAFLVDNCENIYLSGFANGINSARPSTIGMPITSNGLDTTTTGYDFYLLELSTDAVSLLYATYFGGDQTKEHVHGGTNRYDKKGIIYQSLCTGCGGYDDFPGTLGAYPNSGNDWNHANCNNGVFKLNFEEPLTVADFIVSPQYACESQTIQFTNKNFNASSFLWDFGNGDTTSTVENPQRTYNNTGTYEVKLFAFNPLNCNIVDSVSIYITILPKTHSAFNYSVSPCTKNMVFNDSSYFNPTNWFWDFGDGNTSSLQHPQHLYADTGTYIIKLITSNFNGCADTLTKSVTVPPLIETDYGYTIDTCAQEVTFTDSTTTTPISWIWNLGDGATSTAQNPVHTYSSSGTYTVQLTATNSSGCSDTIPQQVVVPFIGQPGFTSTLTPCTYEVSFTDTTTFPVIVTRAWKFGDGTSDTIISNPVHVYAAAGTYTVQLITSNVYGCSDIYSQPVSVFPLIEAHYNYTINPCEKLVEFTDSSLNSPVSWHWDFDDGTISTLENPSHVYVDSGWYNVELIATNSFGCSDTTEQLFYILDFSELFGFTYSVTPCTFDVVFTDTSSVSPISWFWNFDDGTTETIQNPQHSFILPDTYTIQLIVTSTNECIDTIETSLTLSDPPVSIGTNAAICIHEPTQLNATGGVVYQWSPGESLNDSLIADPIATPTITTTYTVNITTITAQGDSCIKTLTQQITVFDTTGYYAIASVDNDTIYDGQSTIIHANINPDNPFTWLSSENDIIPSVKDVPVSPTITTTYSVVITSTENAGCPISTDITIYVIKCEPTDIFIPNTFTPNSDNKNDILLVRGNNITDLYFAVYNRWGEIVFETTDIKVGWDGIYKGRPADPFVYAWYLKAKCYNGEAIEQKGNVTLIR